MKNFCIKLFVFLCILNIGFSSYGAALSVDLQDHAKVLINAAIHTKDKKRLKELSEVYKAYPGLQDLISTGIENIEEPKLAIDTTYEIVKVSIQGIERHQFPNTTLNALEYVETPNRHISPEQKKAFTDKLWQEITSDNPNNEIISSLIAFGAEINSVREVNFAYQYEENNFASQMDCTPLILLLIKSCNLETVNLLVNNGAHVNYKTRSGMTPLLILLRRKILNSLLNDGQPKIQVVDIKKQLQTLLEAGADVNYKMSLIHQTISLFFNLQNYKTINDLINKEVGKVEFAQEKIINKIITWNEYLDGYEKLVASLSSELPAAVSTSIVEHIVIPYMNNNLGPINSTDFLWHAITIDDIKMAKLAIKYAADVNAVNDKGLTPLSFSLGNDKMTKLLLSSGADLELAKRIDRDRQAGRLIVSPHKDNLLLNI